MPPAKRAYTEGSIVKALIALAVPVVFANILQTAYQITDTFWVGRLGAEAVAAVSLSFPIVFLLMSLGGGLAVAGNVLVAQYHGKKNQKQVDYVAAQTITLLFFISVALSLIGLAISNPLMHLMGAEPEVLPSAVAYLQITFAGLLFFFAYFAFQSLLRGVGEVKFPIYVVLSTVLLNFVLDPLFILGYGPVPGYGVVGAAIATIFTQALSAVIGIFVLLRGTHGIKVHLHELKPDISLMTRMFRLGFPASIEQSTRALGLTIMTFLVASFGTIVVAAYGIGIRILSFIIIPAIGLSMATTTLVGQNMGAGKIDRAEKTAKVASLIGFLLLSGIGVIIFLLAQPLAALFIPGEAEAIRIATLFIRIMALFFGFIGIQQTLNGTFRGSGNTFVSMILAIVSLWVLQFPLAYVLSHHTPLGSTGLWIAFPASNVIAALIALIWFWRGTWKEKRVTDEIELRHKTEQEAATEDVFE